MHHSNLFFTVCSLALLTAGISLADPAIAQDETSPEAAGAIDEAVEERRSFTPADFARFSPRNALEIVEQIPAFQLVEADSNRGLGQASSNVLVDGQRLSSKSETVSDQLRRIPVDKVARIEIVDGASLDIPGLTGQVANIVTVGGSFEGTYEWQPTYDVGERLSLLQGNISVSGSAGDFEFTGGVSNDASQRREFFGTSRLFDPADQLFESRESIFRTIYDQPKLSASVKWTPREAVIANARSSYRWVISDSVGTEDRADPHGPISTVRRPGFTDFEEFELGGDLTFPFIGGSLKLIGLASNSWSDFGSEEVLTDLASGIDTGTRFLQNTERSERIARGEFSWSSGSTDWQIAGEAAFNTLDNVGRLFLLDEDGEFVERDFPGAVGGVTEDRYEGSLTYGRPLASTMKLQATAAVEQSMLATTGANANERSFLRPKGSVSLAWDPSDDLDLSFTARRRVGQLQFSDFLARIFLEEDRQNAGNNDLLPPQSWEYVLEGTKRFGAYGSVNLRAFHYEIEDLVDIILVEGGESPGNIDSASRTGASANGTLQLEPFGVAGAKFDLSLSYEDSNVTDPLTGLDREIIFTQEWSGRLDFRHDISGSDIAYGGYLFYGVAVPYFRIREQGILENGQFLNNLFVEHKDVFGLKVRAQAFNLFGDVQTRARTIFADRRDIADQAFREVAMFRRSPYYRLSMTGSF